MKPYKQSSRYHQTGFSLIEIMVGLVIGLLATLVIMQVFSVFEGQKRTTTGVADAQTNGSIALFSLKRDLQMAGYGMQPLGVAVVADSPIECQTLRIDADAASGITVTGDTTADIAAVTPVIITDGGSTLGTNNSDSITIHYGTSDMGGIPSQISDVGANADQVLVPTDMGCQANDIALIYLGNACALVKVNSLTAAASGIASTVTLSSARPPEAVADASLACLGTWNEITYQVSNGNLERVGNGIAVPIISDIVNIQAQYGISDNANSNQISQWVNASTAAGWDAPTVADRNRIKAVRVAIVARNGLLEREEVSTICSSITSDNPSGLCAWSATSLAPINPSPAPWIYLSDDADGASWKRYRYRVFETVIPLRNVIWSRATL